MNATENSTTDPSAHDVSEPDVSATSAEPQTPAETVVPDAVNDSATETQSDPIAQSAAVTATDVDPTPVSEQNGPTDSAAPVRSADAVTPVDSGTADNPETGSATEVAEPDVPKPAPIADDVLLAAVDVARDALLKITPASSVGEPAGHIVEDDHVLSLLFATTLPGYPGWNWTVTLARVEDGAPMVLETELMPGENALLAPDWVPWSERLADYRAAQEAAEVESRALLEAAAELDDEDDDEDDDEGYSILHAGDLDGVDVDEIDESDDETDDDSDENDDDESDDDESDDDDDSEDDDSDDDDDESDDDDDESDDDDDDDESDDHESERSY